MPIKRMSVSDWIKVQDNPIQRDTERHAAKAKHLLTPLPIHAITYAAELPDGKLVKLDGHTRALLWKRNQVKHPAMVECNLIAVKDIEEAKALYQTLDSKEAVESATDKISGAFGEHNFYPESGLLRGGGISTALRLVWNVLNHRAITGHGTTRLGYNVYEAVREFSNEIFALDAFDIKSGAAPSGIVSAFLLTHRRHGAAIIPFWQAVFADGGTKKDGRMDGVQALNELVLQRKGKFGGTAVADMCCRSVMAAEKWLKEEDFQAIPRPFDLTDYIKGKQPQFQLIKKAAAG